ncbi:MAG: TetR/AcrR family transcriptional regulator [Proteobacteria bacterium]|nr:TetR/AcrR family transcriptional regulator [Pseudomonadota bacterium]MBU1449477.1 TetR/AcrR family transcriptional regulator [Pseudomonadota bacterium]MBU2468773.1 TetR/AcrR family transcriptional regulator [Pseudomonadota bacterium]MBU2516566.1 TetR/AcrR family transcriptional regulator [Pseudomonadota bacterium]
MPTPAVAKANHRRPRDLFGPDLHRRLQAAVLEVFSNADFHRASVRTLAKTAGVSFSTIYKNYGSKEELLFAFVDQWMEGLTERIVDHLRGIENLKEKLRKVFWLQLDYYERNPGLGRIIFMTVPLITWMNNRTFAQKRMIGLYLETLRQGQEHGVLNSGVRPQVLLDFMHGLVQRSFFMWVYRGQKDSLSGQSNQLFDMVWRAIGEPAKPAESAVC